MEGAGCVIGTAASHQGATDVLASLTGSCFVIHLYYKVCGLDHLM